ncbi:unnamed protein product [Somion occarium]|uniref:Uncharacterized protein n=1 Tax=Somion occarium TaxID=3059160 RepID=A0ABP1DGA3_9APHY
MSIPLDEFTAFVSAAGYPGNAIRHFSVVASHDSGEHVGSISGFLLNRLQCRGRFLQRVDTSEYCEELSKFTHKLFDNNGLLKQELVEQPYHRGTGCWGHEVDKGMIIYNHEIEVEDTFRHMGLGSFMLRELFKSDYVHSSDFVFAQDVPVTQRPLSLDEFQERREKAEAFLHKNGFRRVGRTNYMAYSPNPRHPSRAIPADQDAQSNIQFSRGEINDDSFDDESDHNTIEHAKVYPIHYAIATASSQESSRHRNVRTSLKDTIRNIHAADHGSIHLPDEAGATPLHYAASRCNLLAIRALLECESEGDLRTDLKRRDNILGTTPLEACEWAMRNIREDPESLEDAWSGHPDEGLRCSYILRKAAGENVGDEATFIESRRWGCTCGNCLEGWLSPRMRYRLMSEAAELFQMMDDSRPLFRRNGMPEPAQDYIGMYHIPQSLRRTMTNATFDAYRLLVASVNILLSRNTIPTPEAMITHSQGDAARHFTECGGNVESALNLVIDTAKDQSVLGDSEWDDSIADSDDDVIKEWNELPKCANDLDFGLVRARLGLSSVSTGPDRGMFDFGEDDYLDMGGFEYDVLPLDGVSNRLRGILTSMGH